MPCINHKRKSSLSNNNKTSRKSKRSTKHKSRSFRNKKTRSNVRKMRGGAELDIKNVFKPPIQGDTFTYDDNIIYTINQVINDTLYCMYNDNNKDKYKEFIYNNTKITQKI